MAIKLMALYLMTFWCGTQPMKSGRRWERWGSQDPSMAWQWWMSLMWSVRTPVPANNVDRTQAARWKTTRQCAIASRASRAPLLSASQSAPRTAIVPATRPVSGKRIQDKRKNYDNNYYAYLFVCKGYLQILNLHKNYLFVSSLISSG